LSRRRSLILRGALIASAVANLALVARRPAAETRGSPGGATAAVESPSQPPGRSVDRGAPVRAGGLDCRMRLLTSVAEAATVRERALAWVPGNVRFDAEPVRRPDFEATMRPILDRHFKADPAQPWDYALECRELACRISVDLPAGARAPAWYRSVQNDMQLRLGGGGQFQVMGARRDQPRGPASSATVMYLGVPVVPYLDQERRP
jgi:hypothetical protein